MLDSLIHHFTFVSFQKIPRVENKVANAMATLTSLLQLERHESRFEFLVEELHHPIYDSQESHVIHTFMMALYLKPLRNLNVETLFKMPLTIPLSLVICIGGVWMKHFLDT